MAWLRSVWVYGRPSRRFMGDLANGGLAFDGGEGGQHGDTGDDGR